MASVSIKRLNVKLTKEEIVKIVNDKGNMHLDPSQVSLEDATAWSDSGDDGVEIEMEIG